MANKLVIELMFLVQVLKKTYMYMLTLKTHYSTGAVTQSTDEHPRS